jgi:hypothetical protein
LALLQRLCHGKKPEVYGEIEAKISEMECRCFSFSGGYFACIRDPGIWHAFANVEEFGMSAFWHIFMACLGSGVLERIEACVDLPVMVEDLLWCFRLSGSAASCGFSADLPEDKTKVVRNYLDPFRSRPYFQQNLPLFRKIFL